MNWIEKLFGLAPDGNSGTAEIAVGFTIAFGIAGLAIWRTRRRRSSERTSSFSHRSM